MDLLLNAELTTGSISTISDGGLLVGLTTLFVNLWKRIQWIVVCIVSDSFVFGLFMLIDWLKECYDTSNKIKHMVLWGFIESLI